MSMNRFRMKVLLVLVVVLGCVVGTSASGSWGYGETGHGVYGPADWGHVSQYCNGRAQSPVNIDRDDVEDDDDDDDDDHDLRVRFDNEHGLVYGTLRNNGHAPTLAVDNARGGASVINPFNGQKYNLAQFHFHFGCTDTVGSEHTVDGKSYPGELHLVFYNAKYGNLPAAATKPDGLTVIGVFLRKSSYRIQELLRFSQNMNSIRAEGSEVYGITVKLADLVPGLSSGGLSYYTYKGSLTTPGCYESVRWVVLKDPINASEEILNNFRALQATHGYSHGKMCNNFRPTQPLNGREITLHE